ETGPPYGVRPVFLRVLRKNCIFAELRKTTNRLETRMNTGGASRNRTDVHGFAIRCITTLPLRQGQVLPSPRLYRNWRAHVWRLGQAAPRRPRRPSSRRSRRSSLEAS